jgi:hypothetical protein
LDQNNKIVHPFENLSLWEYFVNKSGADEKQVTLVKDHISFALPLLDQYVETFPIYTLHNLRHQQNIIWLMGELLDSEIEKLTSLECAVLILSAVYHDIGMVFNKKDIESISHEDEFMLFLRSNTKAQLLYEENKRVITQELIEWYCRWAHAKRVWVFLNLHEGVMELKWDSVSFKEELGNVCESHNESIQYLKDDEKFDINFLATCDLRFCAVLLRLADILDFDNSRSPKSVYEYLEIDKPKNKSESISKDEWNKHLNSGGFTFNRNNELTIYFKASPSHPNVEIGIRRFISLIESELYSCAKLLPYCSKRWRDFKLPTEINTYNIKSENYKSGNYHFNLSEDKVLNLLTGEGLYNDEFVFIREILQNAIDTSRYREFIEKITNPTYKAQPIEISRFFDSEGYQWIQIDDYGMGMTQEIITNHFLKKGESFYNSDRFKLDKLIIKEKTNNDFVPISRFGIGLLSCFIAGDKIEVSTRSFSKDRPEEVETYRLTVEGRNGFFVLQSKNERHRPTPMPIKNNTIVGYRLSSGTSIAVRIKTAQEFVGFDLRKKIESYVVCPPVPIYFEGSVVGTDLHEVLDTPLAEEKTIQLDEEFVKRFEEFFSVELPNGIFIKILPIDVTSNSINKNLKGQLLFIFPQIPDLSSGLKGKSSISFKEDNSSVFKFICTKNFKENGREIETSIDYDISDAIQSISIPSRISFDLYDDRPGSPFNKIILSHNGISIKSDSMHFVVETSMFDLYSSGSHSRNEILYTGILYFQDDFLPNLSVSRNEIKSLSFDIISHLLYSTKELNLFLKNHYYDFDYFDRLTDLDTYFTTKIIKASGFYESSQAYWDNQNLIHTEEGVISITAAKELISKGDLQVNTWTQFSLFYRSLIKYIIEKHFSVQFFIGQERKYDNNLYSCFVLKQKNTNDLFFEEFEPLLFLEFINSNNTIEFHNKINRNHPLISWYFKWHHLLIDNYYYYSRQLIFILIGYDKDVNSKIEKINTILKRLRTLLPDEAKPSELLNLSVRDFEVIL